MSWLETRKAAAEQALRNRKPPTPPRPIGEQLSNLWETAKNAVTTPEGAKGLALGLAKMGTFPFSALGQQDWGDQGLLDVAENPSQAALPAWFRKATEAAVPATEGLENAHRYLQDLSHKAARNKHNIVQETREAVQKNPGFEHLQRPVQGTGPQKPVLKIADKAWLVPYHDPNSLKDIWSLSAKTPAGEEILQKRWISITPDEVGVPSISLLRDLDTKLKGQGFGRKAYGELANFYKRLRSDPYGNTSSMAKGNIWQKIGEKFHDSTNDFIPERFEVAPVKGHWLEKEKNIYQKGVDRIVSEIEPMAEDLADGYNLLDQAKSRQIAAAKERLQRPQGQPTEARRIQDTPESYVPFGYNPIKVSQLEQAFREFLDLSGRATLNHQGFGRYLDSVNEWVRNYSKRTGIPEDEIRHWYHLSGHWRGTQK